MAVFRVEKNKSYTVMSNYHLQDKRLSLKAKGLLSLMLSLPETWNYTLRGLAAICLEGLEAIRKAVSELESNGYILRHQARDTGGAFLHIEYTIYEQPQDDKQICPEPETPCPDSPCSENPNTVKPHTEQSNTGNPISEDPHSDTPMSDNRTQYITKQESKKEKSTDSENIYPSISSKNQREEMEMYREWILDGIEYDVLCQRYPKERLDEIVELMLETLCNRRTVFHIGEDQYPAELVRSRMLQLNEEHIEYVIDCMDRNTTQIHNMKKYLLKALFNAPESMEHYYAALIQQDLNRRKNE